MMISNSVLSSFPSKNVLTHTLAFYFFLSMLMLHLLLLLFLPKSAYLCNTAFEVKNYCKQPVMIVTQMIPNTSTFLTTSSKLFKLSITNCLLLTLPLTALLIVFTPKIVTNRMIDHNEVIIHSVASVGIVVMNLVLLAQDHFLIINIDSSTKLSMLSKLSHLRPILPIVYAAKL